MVHKPIVLVEKVRNADQQPSQFAGWLPEPERIVGLGFRYWTHGWKSGDIASWECAWNFYCRRFGVCGAREALGNLSHWVNTLNQAAMREIEVFPQACCRLFRDECIAVGMVAACQHKACPAMRACAYALIESSRVDDVVNGAKAFADTLMSLDQVLSPASAVTPLALVSPVNGYSH